MSSKILVFFFSRPGGNFVGGRIVDPAITIADCIQEVRGFHD